MPDQTISPLQRNAEALFYEGVALLSAGSASQAEACFRQAAEICPEFGEAHANLGLLLAQRGETVAAEVSLRHALELGAHNAEIYLNLGSLLAEKEEFAQAENIYMQGLCHHSDAAPLWSNLGVLHACLKQEDKAEICYRTALQLDNRHGLARFNLAYVLLRKGNLQEGFACLEGRDWYAALDTALSSEMNIPRWQGEPLEGKSILITCEAGHGDMIQFCRYARELKARGASDVSVLCHTGLRRLFATLDGIDNVYTLGQNIPGGNWDFWCPPLSLPHYCGITLETIPAHIPYLHAQPQAVVEWNTRLPAGKLRVGLAWRGNPKYENDAHRSLPHLARLIPLWSVQNVHLVSLQKGPGEDEIRTIAGAFPLANIGTQLSDFADTAAVIANLDLVISVDTAVAHLAGAMGKPCWVLLPDFKTDWRWLTDRDDTPWYPGRMRLFRQDARHNWDIVVHRVTSALEVFAKTHTKHEAGV